MYDLPIQLRGTPDPVISINAWETETDGAITVHCTYTSGGEVVGSCQVDVLPLGPELRSLWVAQGHSEGRARHGMVWKMSDRFGDGLVAQASGDSLGFWENLNGWSLDGEGLRFRYSPTGRRCELCGVRSNLSSRSLSTDDRLLRRVEQQAGVVRRVTDQLVGAHSQMEDAGFSEVPGVSDTTSFIKWGLFDYLKELSPIREGYVTVCSSCADPSNRDERA